LHYKRNTRITKDRASAGFVALIFHEQSWFVDRRIILSKHDDTQSNVLVR
jgi:hypothetical protein